MSTEKWKLPEHLKKPLTTIRQLMETTPGLWDIIACQRGPDSPSERPYQPSRQAYELHTARRERKSRTGAVIRGLSGISTGGASQRTDRDYVELPPENEWDHYDKHIARAAQAMGIAVHIVPELSIFKDGTPAHPTAPPTEGGKNAPSMSQKAAHHAKLYTNDSKGWMAASVMAKPTKSIYLAQWYGPESAKLAGKPLASIVWPKYVGEGPESWKLVAGKPSPLRQLWLNARLKQVNDKKNSCSFNVWCRVFADNPDKFDFTNSDWAVVKGKPTYIGAPKTSVSVDIEASKAPIKFMAPITFVSEEEAQGGLK